MIANLNGRSRRFGLLAERRRNSEAASADERREQLNADRERAESAGGEHSAAMLESVDNASRFLIQADPGVRVAALYFVCDFWNQEHRYRETILQLAASDPETTVRKSAMVYLATSCAKREDRDIPQFLAQIVADPEETLDVRQNAYLGLRRSVGLDPFRYGLPIHWRGTEHFDWMLVNACLHRQPFAIQDEDLPVLQRLRKQNPDLFTAMDHFRAGDQFFDAGDDAAAIRHYSDGLILRPNACGSLCMRGCAHGNLGDLDAALADFNTAITLKADVATYYRERARAHRLLGHPDLAEADEKKADELEREETSR